MAGEQFYEAQDRFQRKYGFEKTFTEMDVAGRATASPFKYVDSFLPTSDGMSYENREYLYSLTYMLNKYVDDRIRPIMDTQREYSIDQLDIVQFVKDYEELNQLRHELKSPKMPRKPYEGIEDKVWKEAVGFSKGLNKSFTDIWAENIKNGVYSTSELERTTNDLKYGGRNHRKTSDLLYRAMEKAANSRSLGYKLNPLNWPRMIREYICRSKLETQLKEVKITDYQHREAVSEKNLGPLYDEKNTKAVEDYQAEREKEIRAQQEKVAPARTQFTAKEAADDGIDKNVGVEKKHDVPQKALNQNKER